jgi:hypothetical protein
MPYIGEKASKGGHSDLVRNPDVAKFLDDCDYLHEPSEEDANRIADSFKEAPSSEELPLKVVASDASPFSDPISGIFPSTQVGYVKISLVLIDIGKFGELKDEKSRFVDPFKIAELHKNADSLAFTLPGSNVRYKKAKTVSDGFRRAVWDQLSDPRTRLTSDDKYTITSTLLALEDGEITVKKCPSCSSLHEFLFDHLNKTNFCPSCNQEVFITDSLRIHEQISEFGDNGAAITRFMNVTEHLVMASLIRMLADRQPENLSKMAFIIDGPLAIFGQPAKIHARLMKFYNDINFKLENMGINPPVIIGIQKTGQVMEHLLSIERFLKPNTFKIVSDEYRSRFISGVVDENSNFGHETYYGQDFLFKSPKNKVFAFAVPYPFEKKTDRKNFAQHKSDLSRYERVLTRSLNVIRHFELDLYANSVIPIALAHRHASISLTPGGKVLELMTKNMLNN